MKLLSYHHPISILRLATTSAKSKTFLDVLACRLSIHIYTILLDHPTALFSNLGSLLYAESQLDAWARWIGNWTINPGCRRTTSYSWKETRSNVVDRARILLLQAWNLTWLTYRTDRWTDTTLGEKATQKCLNQWRLVFGLICWGLRGTSCTQPPSIEERS